MVNFLVYMSLVLQAGSSYYQKECWTDPLTQPIQHFVALEFYIFIFNLIAMPAFYTYKWLCNYFFGGFRLVITYRNTSDDPDNFGSYAGHVQFYMVYFTCIATAIQMLIDIGGENSKEE